MTTIHSYTNDQQLLDLPHKDLRRARAAALSMIPDDHRRGAARRRGAAGAQGQARRHQRARADAERLARRSVALLVDKKTTTEDVNAAFKAAAAGAVQGHHRVRRPRRSSRSTSAATRTRRSFDSPYTKVIDGDFVKVLAWYDNEWGYSSRCVDLLRYMAQEGL